MKVLILAYVDPGVGALAWQMVLSAVVGTFFYLKQTRDWIVKSFLKFFHLKSGKAGGPLSLPSIEATTLGKKPAPAAVPVPPQRNSTCSKPA